MQLWKWYVYIIECGDGTYYTGMISQPDKRFTQHLTGLGGAYTARHGVKQLVYIEEFEDFEQTRLRERQIKDWNRSKKQKLINGQWGTW